jgi:hypothetical protein
MIKALDHQAKEVLENVLDFCLDVLNRSGSWIMSVDKVTALSRHLPFKVGAILNSNDCRAVVLVERVGRRCSRFG